VDGAPHDPAPGDTGPQRLPRCPGNPAISQFGGVRSEEPEGRSEAPAFGGATKALPPDPVAELAERLRSLSEADRRRLAALLG
jgi:hypothetical protein